MDNKTIIRGKNREKSKTYGKYLKSKYIFWSRYQILFLSYRLLNTN